MGKRHSTKRGLRARDVSGSSAIVTPAHGTVVTNVTSPNGVTVFGETWVIQGTWYDTTQIEGLVTTEID